MAKRYFTLDEANSMLPYLREELGFMQAKKSELLRTYRELQSIKQKKLAPSALIDDAIFKLECSLDFMQMEVQMHLETLYSKGIQVKDLDIGLIDFPAVIDGQEVLLCWKQDEESITHYHGEQDGFLGRKPL